MNWDINRLVRAVRHSFREEGSGFSPYFHRGFEWLSDTDAMSISAYLQTLPAVDNHVDRREVGFLTRNTIGIFKATAKDVPGFVPEISKKETLKYGEYLVDNVARCGRCHNSPGGLLQREGYLTGGMDITVDGTVKVAPELLGVGEFGIGTWNEDNIISYLRTGRTPDQREVDSTFCPIPFYRMANNEDLTAIAKYLKSLTVS